MNEHNTKLPSAEDARHAPALNMRRGQRRVFDLIRHYRMLAFVARRQYGKTTTFANIGLLKMMRTRNHTVLFGSAKLNLSREIVRKEAEAIEKGISSAIRKLRDGSFQVADSDTHKLIDKLTPDDFADLFEAQRLEFRYYHDRGSYSRTKVVALRPDTVGETGDFMADEVGRIGNWRETWEAVEPIVASNPDFKLLLSTTVPPDDTHYSFEQLAPPPGMEFPPNIDGHIYESNLGVTVFRLSAADAYLDGIPLYDLKTGRPMTPEEHRAASPDKDAWDRNYGCIFLMGGTAAVGLLVLMDAMERGRDLGCVYSERGLPPGWERLFTGGPLGIGVDPATTEGGKSNPTGIVVTERVGGMYLARLVLSYKSSDPAYTKAILRELCAALRPQAVALDASSERYWCSEVARDLSPLTHVMLMVSGEKTQYLGVEMNNKTYLGNLAINTLEEPGVVALPPDAAIRTDFRLVKRVRGTFDADLDSVTGRHGDLFDGFKLSLHALINGTGVCEAAAVPTAETPPVSRRDRFIINSDDLPDDDIPGRYIHGA